MARPHKPLNDVTRAIWNLAVLGCTYEEISRVCGISYESLVEDYKETIKDAQAKLSASLRRAQIKQALRGNTTMLVWLGKIILHQKEQVQLDVVADHTLTSFVQSLRQNDPRLAEGPEEEARLSLPAQGRKDGQD